MELGFEHLLKHFPHLFIAGNILPVNSGSAAATADAFRHAFSGHCAVQVIDDQVGAGHA